MPELPDVEGFRRYLARHAAGHRIVRVEVPDRELIRNSSASALSRAIIGQRFAHPLRHGKWLIAPVGELELLLHFGMTGFLRWSSARDRAHGDSSHRQPRDPRGKPRDPYDRVIFDCDDGELRYNNMRRFGGIWLARDERERAAVTGPLGPDAAALERRTFNELLSKRRGSIKAALMDQRLIAGIGNLLSDEILWRARVHPATPVASLGPNRRGRLFEALDATVSESICYGRVPHGERWFTRMRDDRGAICPRCGARLRWATIAGRTACWCPRDQPSRGGR